MFRVFFSKFLSFGLFLGVVHGRLIVRVATPSWFAVRGTPPRLSIVVCLLSLWSIVY